MEIAPASALKPARHFLELLFGEVPGLIEVRAIVPDGPVRQTFCATTAEAVDALLGRFLRMPISPNQRDAFVAFLDSELGTSDLSRAQTYMEDPLRMVTHLIMSTPEYQID